MAARSPSCAGRMNGSINGRTGRRTKEEIMAVFFICPLSSVGCRPKQRRPGRMTGALANANYVIGSAAIAEEAQHEQEQVDEVEVERQRAHHGLAADNGSVLHRIVHLLDALRVPCGEPGEDEHAGG